MPRTQYDRFCQELVDIDESIVAAFVLSGGILGSHIKLDVPVLKDEDAQRLSRQAATVMGIVKSNEVLFGEVGFVLVRHESVDGMFFPVDSSMTVLIGLVKPYDQDGIERTVKEKIEQGLAKKAFDSI